jgi:hypothetical protein
MSRAILTSLESYPVDIPDEFSFSFKKETGDIFRLVWTEKCLNDLVAKNTLEKMREKLDRARMLNLVDDSTHYRIELRESKIHLFITGTRKTLIDSLFREITTQAKLVLNKDEIDRIVGSMEVVGYE